MFFLTVLPPVLVPRYSEFPAGHSSPPSMPPFQQVPEPTMPHNVTYPNNFRQGPHSPASSGPGSPYGVPGKTLDCFLKHKEQPFKHQQTRNSQPVLLLTLS